MDDIESMYALLDEMRSRNPKRHGVAYRTIRDSLARDLDGEGLPRTLVIAIAYTAEQNLDPRRNLDSWD